MTKEELKRLSDDTFFDNDTGEIQPEAHRRFNDKMIDHTDTVAEATLRNSREYTDAREVAILATVDTKDESTLRTAKEYADRIVAALAGSAPETLDTLQELAEALGNDPNFSATVMQMLGERVTTEALNQALAGRMPVVKAQEGRPEPNSFGVVTGLSGNFGAPLYGAPLLSFGAPGYEAQIILGGIGAWQGAWNRIYFRNRDGDTGTVADWKEFWHSGNFDPSVVFRPGNYIEASALNDNATAKIGNIACPVHYGEYTGLLVSFSATASPSPLQFFLPHFNSSQSLQWRHGVDSNVFKDPKFRTIWDSENLKPTYYAQIDPNGNIVGQVGNWIQSVVWEDNGYGYNCSIVPKVSVNTNTIQVTRIAAGGNNFYWMAPVVRLYNNEILVYLPETGSYHNEKGYFNISIQGA